MPSGRRPRPTPPPQSDRWVRTFRRGAGCRPANRPEPGGRLGAALWQVCSEGHGDALPTAPIAASDGIAPNVRATPPAPNALPDPPVGQEARSDGIRPSEGAPALARAALRRRSGHAVRSLPASDVPRRSAPKARPDALAPGVRGRRSAHLHSREEARGRCRGGSHDTRAAGSGAHALAATCPPAHRGPPGRGPTSRSRSRSRSAGGTGWQGSARGRSDRATPRGRGRPPCAGAPPTVASGSGRRSARSRRSRWPWYARAGARPHRPTRGRRCAVDKAPRQERKARMPGPGDEGPRRRERPASGAGEMPVAERLGPSSRALRAYVRTAPPGDAGPFGPSREVSLQTTRRWPHAEP